MKRGMLPGLLMAAALALQAQETTLQIDPAQTEVEYTLDAMLHTVHGKFQLRRGSMRFDPATGVASGEVAVDARSGDSGNHGRDQKMHKEVLESERFAEIVFRPSRVEGKVAAAGDSQVSIHGMFVIHGAEHAITVPAEVRAEKGEFTVVAHFDVPYVKWGMRNPSSFFLRVSDKVQVTIRTVAKPRPESSHN